jgi:hypothetical protein
MKLTNNQSLSFRNLLATLSLVLAIITPVLTVSGAAPTAGLVGYWNFDSASLAETSGFTPAGTHDGLPEGSVAFISGPVGKALDLTAANTAVKIKHSNASEPGYQGTFDRLLYASADGFTITAWVKGLPGSWNAWISKYGEGSSGYQVRRHGGDNMGTFTIRSSDGEDDPYNVDGISFADDGWHHVGAVYDPVNGQRLFYVDGSLDFAIYDGNLDPAFAPAQNLVFGARNADTTSGVLEAFSAVALDEVRVYQRALSAEEVASMYLPGIQVSPDMIVAYTPAADTNAVQLTVPDELLASGALDVVVTSEDPLVAVPVGAVKGAITIHFNQGGPGTQSFYVHAANEGVTKFTYSSTRTWVNGTTTINVWADLGKSGNTVFLDTFNVSANSTNLDFQIAQRQSGSAASIGYANLAVNLKGNPYDPKWFQVGAADATGWLRLGGEGTANAFPGASPSVMVKHSFIESKHFLVEYDILGYTEPDAGGWAGVKILDSTGTPQFLNGGDGFGFMFSGNGNGLAFDGGTQIYSFANGTFDPVANNHMSLEVVTGGWDGARTGQTTISLRANGKLIRTFTLKKNYKGNYISMYYALPAVGFPNVCTFDNLKVTIAPSAYANVTSTTTGVGTQSAPVTVYVPAVALASGDIDVVVSSTNPTIAVPTGATGANLTLHFVKSGTNALSFTAMGQAMGQTVFTLNSPQVKTSGSVGVSVGFLTRTAVDNASFEDSYTPAWTPPGYLFMNRWTPNTENTGFNGSASGQTILDFADNGILPDRNLVAFIENSGSFQQNLQGLAMGAPHWLQFRYNVSANSSSGLPVGTHRLLVTYNGKIIDVITNATPVESAGSNTRPWYFRNVPFVADVAGGAMKFEHIVDNEASAPAIILIDALSVVMRGPNEVVIENPSFEASGKPINSPYYFENDVNIAGWATEPANGWGVNAPGDSFCDNGQNPDQDHALFVQGAGKSVSQTISGLTAGERYQLSFAYNARQSTAKPRLRVTMGGQELMSAEVAPVGGKLAFLRTNLVFTASSASMSLKFANIVSSGDTTFLLDDVHLVLLGKTAPTLKIQLVFNSVRISWPADASGFRLQRTPRLQGTWENADLPVTVVGSEKVVYDLVSGSGVPFVVPAQYYRLAQ